MTLTIYGPPMSRAMRTLWMAHELGLDFQHEYGFREDALVPTEAVLAADPMGQVPAINDDGFMLAEAMAVNIYLAKKHGKLAPQSFEDEAQTLRWSFWVMDALRGTIPQVTGSRPTVCRAHYIALAYEHIGWNSPFGGQRPDHRQGQCPSMVEYFGGVRLGSDQHGQVFLSQAAGFHDVLDCGDRLGCRYRPSRRLVCLDQSHEHL